MPGKRKWYSENFRVQAMQPIDHKECGGIAQRGQSLISTSAMLSFKTFFIKSKLIYSHWLLTFYDTVVCQFQHTSGTITRDV